MNVWTADFANDPYNDYSPIVEILYDDKDVAVIIQGKDGLELKWYPNKRELIIPLQWLCGIIIEFEKRLK